MAQTVWGRSIPQKQSPLLNLPGELKNEIYKRVTIGHTIAHTAAGNFTMIKSLADTTEETAASGYRSFVHNETSFHLCSEPRVGTHTDGRSSKFRGLLGTCKSMTIEAVACHEPVLALEDRTRFRSISPSAGANRKHYGFGKSILTLCIRLSLDECWDWSFLEDLEDLQTLIVDIDFAFLRPAEFAQTRQGGYYLPSPSDSSSTWYARMSTVMETTSSLCRIPTKNTHIRIWYPSNHEHARLITERSRKAMKVSMEKLEKKLIDYNGRNFMSDLEGDEDLSEFSSEGLGYFNFVTDSENDPDRDDNSGVSDQYDTSENEEQDSEAGGDTAETSDNDNEDASESHSGSDAGSEASFESDVQD